MKIEHLSLLTSLFAILNENEKEDSFFILAKYFLENYSHIGEMNIYDVADECFVSRASVRRFCQYIGYDNFKNLKGEVKDFDEQFEDYIRPYDVKDFRTQLKLQIDDIIDEIDRNFTEKHVEEIIDTIQTSNQIVFLASDTLNARVKNFQKFILLYGKNIRLVSDSFMDEELLQSLGEKDILIVVSASGIFANAAKNVAESCGAKNVLLTASKNKTLAEYYDKIYNITSYEYKDEYALFMKFGIDYIIDLIFSAYVRKYSAELKYNIKY